MKLLNKLIFKYHNYKFRKTKKKNLFKYLSNDRVNEIFERNFVNQKKLILSTQVGRGGGKWLVDILNHCENVRAFGERNRSEESIYRYNCSHLRKKPSKKLIKLIKSEILTDWEIKDVSYISSPYFSHGISQLDKCLNPNKIVVIVRDFKGLFNSLLNKGWYSDNFDIENINQIKNLPKEFAKRPNHYFGRYLNFNKLNKKFLNSSPKIKVAIFMSDTIKKIYNELLFIKKTNLYLFELNKADQNYAYCKEFVKRLDLKLGIDEKKFLSLKKRTASKNENCEVKLSANEIEEIKILKSEYENYQKKINKLIRKKNN